MPDASRQQQLWAALRDTMKEYAVPGATAGVWMPGMLPWTVAAGLADVATQTPAGVSMSWPLRSVTKSFTVTLILQLVDTTPLTLDHTIGEFVDGVTNGETITLRQLAGMTSGNADYTGDAFLAEFTGDPARIFTLAELNGFVLGQPEQFAPGTRRVYTNANTNLLGAVVEKATGQPFGRVLEERILRPLALQHTGYVIDARRWTDPHPIGYAPGESGLEPQPDNLSIFGPAGSMVSTLADCRVWVDALVAGVLLSPETQAQRRQGGPLEFGPPYDRYALGIGETAGWWGHNGEGLGFTAAAFHHPETGATVVVFMNRSNVVPKAHPADQAFRRMAAVLSS